MIILAVLVCVFNIVMWIVFLHNFKKLFTTDDVIESTKEQINKILTDFDRQTERNLNLLDNSIARLKALNAEAEKKIKIMTEMERSTVGVNQLKTKVSDSLSGARQSTGTAAKKAVDAYSKNKSRSRSSVKEDDSVVLTLSGESAIEKDDQRTLFDEEPKHEKLDITVTDEGASYKEIPVITPKVYVPETPVQDSINKNQLSDSINKLFDQGFDATVIAKQLGCSTTEVQFVLTMAGKI